MKDNPDKPLEVDQEFIEKSFDFLKNGQKRSLLWTITSWLEMSATPTPCVLINTDTLFPKSADLDAKAAMFLPEVYGCIDQLLIALTHCAAHMHQAASTYVDDATEKGRTVAVAEIIKCIATHVHSIRTLSLTGFDVQVKQILRTYIEYLELLALVCAETEALDEFIASADSDEANSFWHRHLAKSKARKKRYFNSVLKSGRSQAEQERDKEWHDRELRLLSESVHPTVSGVIRSGIAYTDSKIVPNAYEDVIGSLIYMFAAFADTLEIPTLDFLRAKLKRIKEDEAEPDVLHRFYLIMILSVMLGYRKDFFFWGESDIEEDAKVALEQEASRRSTEPDEVTR